MAETPNDTGGMLTDPMDRRSALKHAARVAGAAAFATPVVMGVFSSRAYALDGCDPALDSDAVDLLEGKPKKWNINCSSNEKYGRYNAQRTTATLPGPGNLKAVINFGNDGTDNFPVECSYYTFEKPAGWECSATFLVGDANDTDGCPSTGPKNAPVPSVEKLSEPGDCEIWPGPPTDLSDTTPADFQAPGDALPLPYCESGELQSNGSYCVPDTFLWLVEWSCCPPA